MAKGKAMIIHMKEQRTRHMERSRERQQELEVGTRRRWLTILCAAGVSAGLGMVPGVRAQEPQAAVTTAESAPPVAQQLLDTIADTGLKALAQDVLDRNPAVAAGAARARAARQVAPQVKALPDPMLGGTIFAAPPETRVGPQRWSATLSQRLPWFGKLGLREAAALQRAAAQEAQVEAQRLDLVTETRRLYYELGFLDAYRDVVATDRDTLSHYEELARSRYASGVGLQQAVIKIQAEITKDDSRLLDVRNRRATLAAALNALRDRPQDTEIPNLTLTRFGSVALDPVTIRARALALRPEMAAADREIAQAESMVDLARKEYKPDVTLGAAYTWVGSRTDLAGMLSPPPDNGSDVLGVSLSLNLPIKRGKLAAGVEEAAELRVEARERKRAVVTSIDRSLGELLERTRATWDQLRLLEDVLGIQADQSLRSAESGYSAGSISSLDLLDAERMLLEVRTATERARADYAVALARLEGAVGEPLRPTEGASR
jgi:cobalt-zinc-cadmium efflux system outer membrane protein